MDVRLLLKNPNMKRYAAGQHIVGADGDKELYVMICGEAAEGASAPQPGAGFGPGRSLNMRAFLFGDKGNTFTAVEDALVCVMTRDDFFNLLAAQPQLCREFLREAYAKPDELERMNRESRMYATMLERLESKAAQPPVAQPPAPQPPAVQPPAAQPPAPQPPAVQPPAAQPPAPQPPAAQPSATQPPVLQPLAVQPPAAQPAARPVPALQKSAPEKKTVAANVPAGFFMEGHKGYPGIVHPEYKAFIYEKDYTCPNCGKKVKGYKVFQSKLAVDRQPRYDLRQYYIDFQQEWYDVMTCQSCLFSAFPSLFAQPKNFSKSVIHAKLTAAAAGVKLNFGAERSLDDVFVGHYLALLCADAFLQHRSIKAKLWGNLSWLYEDIGEEALEAQAARNAAQANELLYMETDLTPVQEQMVSLIIAGMQYRAGERIDTRKWLYKVKTNRDGKQTYADLGEELMELLREEKGDEEGGQE